MTADQRIKTILLDMDGVLWRGQEPLLDIKALFAGILELNCRVYCVTNNSTKSVSQYQDRLSQYGVDLLPDQIITSAEGTTAYLAQEYPPGSTIFVIGEEGLLESLGRVDCRIATQEYEPGVGVVVVGLDRRLTYQKLKQAVAYIQEGAAFIGTNPDATLPTPTGPAPGTGAILSAIELSTGIKPKLIGKPAPPLFKLALTRANSHPHETIMVGDRLETDILGAQRIGMKTCLVLSGVSSQEDASGWQPAPDRVVNHAFEIIEELRRNDAKLI